MEEVNNNKFNPVNKFIILKIEDGKTFAYEKHSDDDPELMWTEDLWCGKLYTKKGNAQRVLDSFELEPYDPNHIQYKIVPALQVIDIKYVVKRTKFDKDNPIECKIIWYDKGKELKNSFGTRYAAEKELRRLKAEITEEYYKMIMMINRIQLP